MDDNRTIMSDLVHLSRLALTAPSTDIQLFIRRMVKRYHQDLPPLADELQNLLRESPTRSSPLRGQAASPIPVDLDSRLQLLRVEQVTHLDVEPIFSDSIKECLDQIIIERQIQATLHKAGLSPTRNALFTGPPGVGKTLAARWLAFTLQRPLLLLDLSAVMSSFLGRTGNNVRFVLDYAKSVDCILLLDEFDAIAKRRDDTTEVGELKRLVTVLLQEIDEWPPNSLLLAATNHASLLDPAVWRRFDLSIEFPLPTQQQVSQAVRQFLSPAMPDSSQWHSVLIALFHGSSFSDIERVILRLRRAAIAHNDSLEDHCKRAVLQLIQAHPPRRRAEIAAQLALTTSLTQRQVHELTGVSRDTIRRATRDRPTSSR